MSEWKTYVCTYRFEGKEYGCEVVARDTSEALAKLRAMALGRVDGVLAMKFPVHATIAPALVPFVSLWTWVLNLLRRPPDVPRKGERP